MHSNKSRDSLGRFQEGESELFPSPFPFNDSSRLKHLHVTTNDHSSPGLAILKDDWINTEVKEGDIVNLIGEWETSDNTTVLTMILSTTRNFFVLHPDVLIPITSIATASRCIRKPIISSLVRSSLSDVTPATVWGLMLHEIVQECLAAGRWDEEFVDQKTDEVIRASFDRLFQIRVGFDIAKVELKKRSQGLKRFSELYISETPKVGHHLHCGVSVSDLQTLFQPDALLADNGSNSKTPARMAITDLKDVEETIWSPSYGLKGIVDASVDTRIIQNHGPFVDDSQGVLPLEIKTGRASAMSDHRAQTILYTLLMSERYSELPLVMSHPHG